MSTFQALGLTLAVGVGVTTLCFLGFGLAVSRRTVLIAPRAIARPRNVIYNPLPTDPSQNRGNPMFGWIRWTLGLSYDTMLKGVPGTGTREGGLRGKMLTVNMDGIVLLRFHALCLRICMVATVICLIIILPMNYTAQCSSGTAGINYNITLCSPPYYNLTDYDRTTLANVPQAGIQSSERDTGVVWVRHYVTSITFCVLILSVLHLLKLEWSQILAMRRVYYLEKDVWGDRRKEHERTMLYEQICKEKEKMKRHLSSREDNQRRRSGSIQREDSIGTKEHLDDRDPWIPHPEQRDTIPNVSLYSLLVGGLPSLPLEAVEGLDTDAAINFAHRQSIDWQLSLAATLFDHCVPNQPGFSSSIAAITIIPGADDMTMAWKKWYNAASKLRRLRFIRRQIAHRRHYEIDEVENDDGNEDAYVTASQLNAIQAKDEATVSQTDTHLNTSQFNATVPPALAVETDATHPGSEALFPESLATQTKPGSSPQRLIYSELSLRRSYFRQVLGSSVTPEFDGEYYEATNFGPEQASVYAREFAQAAASCCPRGCREGKVRSARIDELLEMERLAAEEVHLANLELNEFCRKITCASPQGNDSGEGATPENDSCDPELQKAVSEAVRLTEDLDLEANFYEKAKAAANSAARVLGQPPQQSANNVPHMDNVGVGSIMSPTASLLVRRNSSSDWLQVQTIVNVSAGKEQSSERSREVADGTWETPSMRSSFVVVGDALKALWEWITAKSAGAVDSVARDSTYAVVTFTSRQAAVAARNCLADGRGGERWLSVCDIPIPPLADAPACDLLSCRNFLRPVTISISNRQKALRKVLGYTLLCLIYIFYTVPLTFAQTLVTPERLNLVIPELNQWLLSLGIDISGLLSSSIFSIFFSICPIMFKAISNSLSNAISVQQSEFRALQYYWFFMLVTAFTGTLIATMVVTGIQTSNFLSELQASIILVAQAIPTTTAFTWLNWIVLRSFVTLPVNYLLTMNSFIYSFLGLSCCTRCETGGGPGGPVPYRIYVDSGVVLLCTLALGPASPLVAVFGLIYFIASAPLWRRDLIFMYRPNFDSGGARFMFLFDMVISMMMIAIVLMILQMALKSAVVPAIICALPAIPTLMYNSFVNTRYKRAYNDAALLQTSLLDGWDASAQDTSPIHREEFRRFLVDAHKAAYIPVCIASPDLDGFITAEPAVVIPLETDSVVEECGFPDSSSGDIPAFDLANEQRVQRGAILRRTPSSPALLRQRTVARGMITVTESEEEAD